jgi:hypothetical protein
MNITPSENAHLAMIQYELFKALFHDEQLAMYAACAFIRTKEAWQEFDKMLNLKKLTGHDSNP